MKTIYIVTVNTEDSEKYLFAYDYCPNKTEIKKRFFEQHGENYPEDDWGVCISYDMEDVILISK
jgi:hypothetical protein